MASLGDIERARAGARQLLENLDNIDRLKQDCDDAPLRDVLADISRRKSAQTARLWDWLAQNGEGFESDRLTENPEPGPEVNPSADPRQLTEPAHLTDPDQDAVTTPATAEGGVEVIERRQVTSDLLIIKVPRPADFNFLPGQSVKVGLEGIKRSYSIVSAPHEPVLEFFVELFPGGEMSERLRRLNPGDRVTLDRPKGSFLLDDRYTEHLMVATVTGINPFVSILRDAIQTGASGHRFHVLHGASYQNEFGYRPELENLAAAHPDRVTYVPTISRPEEPANAGWTGSTGRVDTLVEGYLDRTGLDVHSTMAYACGHSGMIHAVEQSCRPRGFQIKTEDYD